jgi:pyruvate dehydrogenase E2 component (dihydrolipoamide acetyltransferase)
MTDAMALRKQINASVSEEERVSVNDLIVRACALALDRHPAFNVTGDGEQFTRQPLENVCIAIALDDGLIAPAIMDVANKRLPQIALESTDLVARAKGGSLTVDEVSAGTFSITNLGAYGIETLVGIIQPPQTAILGVGTVMEQPAVRDGAVVVRQMMKVALSADHRVTDGAQGAVFLGEIKSLLEAPVGLVL